jgi:hypothetical protein
LVSRVKHLPEYFQKCVLEFQVRRRLAPCCPAVAACSRPKARFARDGTVLLGFGTVGRVSRRPDPPRRKKNEGVVSYVKKVEFRVDRQILLPHAPQTSYSASVTDYEIEQHK